MAGQHRAAGDKDCRNINSGRSHQESGNVLVAVGDHYKTVKTVCLRKAFGRVGNQISRDKGIFHSDVSHCDTVADSNRRNHDWHSAGLGYSELYCLRDFIEIHMARDDFTVGAHDADERLLHFLFRKAKCIEKTSVRCLLYTDFYSVTDHCALPPRTLLVRTM